VPGGYRADVALALYRTYRPGRFADVVGQEHVTAPLVRAIEKNRVHHAYLFSGPRGCGKTSSARILARSLNCAQGPTPEPCGECPSCQDLAPNGPGSLDVVELDAATHGLVDDARDLRERAHFAPVSSRFKIYIIDEAHQLGPGSGSSPLDCSSSTWPGCASRRELPRTRRLSTSWRVPARAPSATPCRCSAS